MKTTIFMVALLAMGLITVTASCDDNDNNTPEDIYVQAFRQMFPEASRIEWENKEGYKVADFCCRNKDSEAWFDKSAKWMMTETDLLYSELPAVIQTAFEASEYATWRVDDVDKIERIDTETIYVIEVESGKQECHLYYAEDGTLIKAVTNRGNKEHQPLTISQAIKDKILALYPGTTAFLEFDREGNCMEIEFKDGKIYKEARFDSNSEWLYTKWDIRRSDVPVVVMNALNASEYGSYKLDDVDMFHNPDGLFYLFEMEKGHKDYYCMFTEAGERYSKDGTPANTVTDGGNKEPDGNNNGGNKGHQPSTISQAIKDKILELYPGTTAFLDIDREGNYMEIEFKDGNTHKEALFDGNSVWVCTKWDIRRSDVPTVVMNALNASEYGSYKLDDVDIFHNPDGLFYLFEMEKGHRDYHCMFTEAGIRVEVPAIAYR